MPSATNIWFASTIFVAAADTSLWLYGLPLCCPFAISTTHSNVRQYVLLFQNTFTRLALKDMNLWTDRTGAAWIIM